MPPDESLIRVRLIHRDLAAVPKVSVPASVRIRGFQTGDRETWLAIEQAADRWQQITPAHFDQHFGAQPDLLPRRMFFLCEGDRAIGTVTAWFNPNYFGQSIGRIHWLAVVPERQGRGLGATLLAFGCERLQALGHLSAYLTTETVRLNAIHLYLRFGFVPDVRDDNDRDAWHELVKRGIQLPAGALSP